MSPPHREANIPVYYDFYLTLRGNKIFEDSQGGGGQQKSFGLFYLKYACQYYGMTTQLWWGRPEQFSHLRVVCENCPHVWGGGGMKCFNITEHFCRVSQVSLFIRCQ